jgi:1-acyl-sn-glycerol-3-phosphate acyltransferase
VQLAFGEPISVAALEATPDAAGELIEEELWPEVTEEYKRLRARPGVVVAGLTTIGLAGLAARRRRRRR